MDENEKEGWTLIVYIMSLIGNFNSNMQATIPKLTILILLTLLSLTTYGQVNIDDLKRNEKGRFVKIGETKPFSGDFKEYFPNNNIKSRGTFKNGLLEGFRVVFDEKGDTVFYRYYTQGIANGMEKEYYPNNKLKQEGEFIDGKEEGVWKFYFENEKPEAIINFNKGIKEGDYFLYNKDGTLKAKYIMKNGHASYGKDIDDLVEEALKYSRKYENEKAIKLYEKAIAINPTIALLYFNRGTCKSNIIDKKFIPEAIRDFDKAIEINPDYMEAYSNRGNAKINQFTRNGNLFPTEEQTKSACEDFQKAKQLGDTDTEDMIFLYCSGRNKSGK